MKKETIKLIVKVILYIITAIAGYFGVTAFSSCTVDRSISSKGRGVGIFNYADTFYIEHGKDVKINVK